MKIISWNLNHRINEKPIPTDVLNFFEKYSPDVILLNEYVDGLSRDGFKSALSGLGYSYQLLSPKVERQNQIFIASRIQVKVGDIAAPDITVAAKTNFLHVLMPESGIEIVGLRAPAYKVAGERKAYWKQVAKLIEVAGDRKIIFLGDINYNPFSGVSASVPDIKFSLNDVFTIPNPEGDWSFISIDGKNKSRIDHAIISESIKASNVKYITTYNGIILAGSKTDNAITDHAVLSLEIEI